MAWGLGYRVLRRGSIGVTLGLYDSVLWRRREYMIPLEGPRGSMRDTSYSRYFPGK